LLIELKVLKDYENKDIIIKIHPYSKLMNDSTDWHTFISLSDLKLVDLLEDIFSPEKLVPLSSMAKAQECDLRHYKFKDFHGFILSDAERIQRKSDHWFVDKIKDSDLIVRHRQLTDRVEIPINCVERALRRFSYITTLDISNSSDYLILSWFDNVKEMAKYLLSANDLDTFNKEIIGSWKRRFDRQKAHLLLARRLYLSSPGTCLITFYSENPTVGIDLWSLSNLDKNEAKVLALWLNSSLNILQLLYIGVACEGPWMKIHDYMINKLLIPDPKKLTKRERDRLLKVFDTVKGVKFPSILDQLGNKHPSRRLIDAAWLKVLGYKGDVGSLLDRLYDSLAKEIELLKRLMAEGEAPEEQEEESE